MDGDAAAADHDVVIGELRRRLSSTIEDNDDSTNKNLIAAARKGQKETVFSLLQGGVEVDWKDEDGCTALHHACRAFKDEDGCTALHHACRAFRRSSSSCFIIPLLHIAPWIPCSRLLGSSSLLSSLSPLRRCRWELGILSFTWTLTWDG